MALNTKYSFHEGELEGPVNPLSNAVAGKTICSVNTESKRMDEYLIFTFTDGTELRILYDYIFEWEVAGK